MKNNPLQRAVIISLLRNSLLLNEEKKNALIAKIPSMSDVQLRELQELIGGEEKVLLHPKDLGLEEVLATADTETLCAMNALIETSMGELHASEQIAGEDQDAKDADAILDSLQ
ncbi:MAG: hypothetical protein Greene041662_361 [Candidatus Peregrinibacteria bacterium Greene0416_62]|nr:MAG: hypothetical protein Greene041662_361 [Candidatus Peregrinibacteria bacterium Greene0416_62]